MKEEYAIMSNDGVYLTSPSEDGYGKFINLMTKETAKRNLAMYYWKGYKIKKMRV